MTHQSRKLIRQKVDKLNPYSPVTGQELVHRIEVLAAEEVEKAQREVWALAESTIQKAFRERGFELSAHETLQTLRKFDLNISSKPMTVKIMQSLWEALDGLRGEISAQEMPEFATFLKDQYFIAKKAETSKRVLLTHVNAALRCFRRRYVSSWQSFYGDQFEIESFTKDVDALNERVVTDPEALTQWAQDVVELSNRYGVDRENRLKSNRELKIAGRPTGIISPSSEGPYSRQWTAWIASNAEKLLTTESERSSSRRGDFMFRTDSGTPVVVEVKKKVQVANSVALEFTSLTETGISAKTSWNSVTEALDAVAGWSSILELAWGKAGARVLCKLVVQTEMLNFEMDIPAGSLSEVSTAIHETLQRLVPSHASK